MILQLKENFEYLNLNNMYNMIIDNIQDDKTIKMLLDASTEEITAKNVRGQNQLIKMAGFPKLSRIEDFDFTYNLQINKNKIEGLLDMKFVTKSENIIFVGTPGVGKTHLAIGLGVKAAENKNSTYFIKCSKLLDQLKQAYDENRLESKIKNYTRHRVLIIDELGFLPIKEIESKLLFQLIDRRYETKSTIITTNVGFENWGQTFSDIVIANAILDRLLHHSHIFKITGESYRTKDLEINEES